MFGEISLIAWLLVSILNRSKCANDDTICCIHASIENELRDGVEIGVVNLASFALLVTVQ